MYRRIYFETSRSNNVKAVNSLIGVIIRQQAFDEFKWFLQGVNSEISERTIDDFFEYVMCFVKAVLYSLTMKDEERECLIRETENKYQSKKMDMLLAYNLHKISMYHAIGVFYLRYEYKIALDGC